MQRKSKQQLKHNEIQPTLRYMASRVRETKVSTCHIWKTQCTKMSRKIWILKVKGKKVARANQQRRSINLSLIIQISTHWFLNETKINRDN